MALTSSLLEYMFPYGRAMKLIRSGVNITNSTNPLGLAKNITFTIVDCCAPPTVKLAVHCVAAVGLVGVSIASPSPVTVGSLLHVLNGIYDNC
jgi:hypothetical protein